MSETNTKRQEEQSIWMSDRQADVLLTSAATQRDRVLCQAGLETGGRINELRNLQVRDFIDREVDGELRYFVRLAKVGDAQKTDASKRESWVTRDLWQQVRFLVRDQDLDEDDYLFQSRNGGMLSTRAARDVVKRTARAAYEHTARKDEDGNWVDGDEDFLYVSSHDLRRYWANKMLNEYNVNPRIVMEMGGWSSFNSMKPYMEPATPENITAAMVDVGNE